MKEPFLKRCDPRVKLLLATSLAIIVAVTQKTVVLEAALLPALLWTFWAGFSPKEVFKKLLPLNFFLLLVLLTVPLTTPGTVLFRAGPLKVSQEGLVLAGLIFWKSNLILWATITLLGTSSIFSLAHALHHLRVPGKLVQLLFFTFRYLDLLKREYHRLWEAALLRGFVPKTNLHTYRTMAYLTGSLLVRSYDRSQRIYEAMLCRGFEGNFPVYRHFSLGRLDLFFGLFWGLYLLTLACWTYLG